MPTAVDKSYRTIKVAILDGTFSRGIHLKEEELAERIGVSRTPIREALRRLDADGLVEFVPNQGAFVTSLGEQDLDELLALRTVIQCYGAELAARNLGPDRIAELRMLADRMDEMARNDGPLSLDGLAQLNERFHRLIMEGAGNKRLEMLLTGQIAIPLCGRTFRNFTREELLRSMSHHRELVESLAAGDPAWAASVMRCHLAAARNANLRSGSGVGEEVANRAAAHGE